MILFGLYLVFEVFALIFLFLGLFLHSIGRNMPIFLWVSWILFTVLALSGSSIDFVFCEFDSTNSTGTYYPCTIKSTGSNVQIVINSGLALLTFLLAIAYTFIYTESLMRT